MVVYTVNGVEFQISSENIPEGSLLDILRRNPTERDSNNNIVLHDISPENFEQVMDYLHCGKFPNYDALGTAEYFETDMYIAPGTTVMFNDEGKTIQSTVPEK